MMAAPMIIYLQILTFFLFAPSLSTASAPECKASYGTHIDIYHCVEALEQWKPRFRNGQQKFSRHPVVGGSLNTMPQAITFQTCSIGVDLVDVAFGDSQFRHVMSTWSKIKTDIDKLLYSCVSPRPGTTPPQSAANKKWNEGGRLVSGNFEVVIIDPRKGVGVNTCLQPHQTPPMSLGRCVEAQANFLQQSRQSQDQKRVQSPPTHPIAPAFSHLAWQNRPPSFSPVQAAAAGNAVPGGHLAPGISHIPGPPAGYVPYQQAVPVYQPVPGYQPVPVYQPVPGYQPIPGYQPVPGVQPAPGFQPVPGVAGVRAIPRPQTGHMAYQKPPPPPPTTLTATARLFDPLNQYSGHGGRQLRPPLGRLPKPDE